MQSPFALHVPTDMSRHTKMDISIMKSDVDFKDPEASAARDAGPSPSNGCLSTRLRTQVLAARQVRPKTSKSDIIRGRRGTSREAHDMTQLNRRWLIPVAHNEQSMWLDLDRQAKLNEAKAKATGHASPSASLAA